MVAPVSVTARDAQHGHLDDRPFSDPVALHVPQSCKEYAMHRLTSHAA